MEFPNALKWSLVNRLFTMAAVLAGLVLVVVGFVLGFWGSIELLASTNPDVDGAIEQANPILTLVFASLGFIIWQLGKTYALFHTLPKASGRAAARRFDHERVKSDVLDGLDDRLTKIEEDLEETRRSVHELKRAEHAAAFAPEDADRSDSAVEGVAPSGSAEDTGAIERTDDSGSRAREAVDDSGPRTREARDDQGSNAPGAGDASDTTSREPADRTTTSTQSDETSEFTFGETEPSTAERTDSTIDESNEFDERDEHRSSGERTDGSENDPLA